jgi:hypothetical protein
MSMFRHFVLSPMLGDELMGLLSISLLFAVGHVSLYTQCLVADQAVDVQQHCKGNATPVHPKKVTKRESGNCVLTYDDVTALSIGLLVQDHH